MGSKKQGFALDWKLPRDWGNPMIEQFNNSYLEEEKSKWRLELLLAKK